jgi:hypothetical protein
VTQSGNFLHTWMNVAGEMISPDNGVCFGIECHFGHLPGLHATYSSAMVCGPFIA